jgi:hypothetical protein
MRRTLRLILPKVRQGGQSPCGLDPDFTPGLEQNRSLARSGRPPGMDSGANAPLGLLHRASTADAKEIVDL